MAHGDITPPGVFQYKPLITLGIPFREATAEEGVKEFAHRSGALHDTPCIVTIPEPTSTDLPPARGPRGDGADRHVDRPGFGGSADGA